MAINEQLENRHFALVPKPTYGSVETYQSEAQFKYGQMDYYDGNLNEMFVDFLIGFVESSGYEFYPIVLKHKGNEYLINSLHVKNNHLNIHCTIADEVLCNHQGCVNMPSYQNNGEDYDVSESGIVSTMIHIHHGEAAFTVEPGDETTSVAIYYSELANTISTLWCHHALSIQDKLHERRSALRYRDLLDYDVVEDSHPAFITNVNTTSSLDPSNQYDVMSIFGMEIVDSIPVIQFYEKSYANSIEWNKQAAVDSSYVPTSVATWKGIKEYIRAMPAKLQEEPVRLQILDDEHYGQFIAPLGVEFTRDWANCTRFKFARFE